MCKFCSLKISAGWIDPLRLNFGGAGRLYGLADHCGEFVIETLNRDFVNHNRDLKLFALHGHIF